MQTICQTVFFGSAEAAAGPEQVPCSGSKTNAKQRRAARRAGEQLLKRQAAAHAACQLCVVLLQALRKMRWERMQAVWTQWMRSRQAEARRREVLLCLRNRLWLAWTRPGATAGPGRLGATSERDKYIRARATRAWLRFGPSEPVSMAVSAPTYALVESSSAEKRGRDTDGASSEASSGKLVVAQVAQPPKRGQRRQRHKESPADWAALMEGFELPPGVSPYSRQADELKRSWRVAQRRQQEYEAVDEGMMAAAEQHFRCEQVTARWMGAPAAWQAALALVGSRSDL